MGKMKNLITDINSNESAYNRGYIDFLEQTLEETEAKLQKLENYISNKLSKCIECFKVIPKGEIVCAQCQDELDGRWDDEKE
tara:strand:- start:486 stop:731 length:246 start_codon:yes stop_codon:yes gene_type:complete